jgi:hypothetical protein
VSVNIEKIQHIKIPVSNLLRSASWYARLLDLDLAREFVEEGVVRGVTLVDRDAGYDVSLRDRDVCSGNPRVADFEVVAFKLRSREALSDFLDAACGSACPMATFRSGVSMAPPSTWWTPMGQSYDSWRLEMMGCRDSRALSSMKTVQCPSTTPRICAGESTVPWI